MWVGRHKDYHVGHIRYASSHFWNVSMTGFFFRTIVTGEPMGPEAESSKRNWISGVWDRYKLSGKSNAKSMYSPLRILSSKDLSNGLERPRGEAIPGVQQLWLVEDGRCAADED